MDSVKPKTRKEAESLGLKYYFTGVPCKRGGIANRRLNGDCLCEKCLDFTKKLKAEWAKSNPEQRKEWAKNNQEKNHGYKMAYQERNREAQKQRIKEWKMANKAKVMAYTRKYQTKKRNAVPLWFDEFDEFVMQEAADIAKRREALTGIKWDVDHSIPLAAKTACGLHVAENIQVIPSALNVRKLNRMMFTEPLEWIKVL